MAAAAMKLSALLYRIESELEDGQDPDVVFTTSEGERFVPAEVTPATDGETLIVHVQAVSLGQL